MFLLLSTRLHLIKNTQYNSIAAEGWAMSTKLASDDVYSEIAMDDDIGGGC